MKKSDSNEDLASNFWDGTDEQSSNEDFFGQLDKKRSCGSKVEGGALSNIKLHESTGRGDSFISNVECNQEHEQENHLGIFGRESKGEHDIEVEEGNNSGYRESSKKEDIETNENGDLDKMLDKAHNSHSSVDHLVEEPLVKKGDEKVSNSIGASLQDRIPAEEEPPAEKLLFHDSLVKNLEDLPNSFWSDEEDTNLTNSISHLSLGDVEKSVKDIPQVLSDKDVEAKNIKTAGSAFVYTSPTKNMSVSGDNFNKDKDSTETQVLSPSVDKKNIQKPENVAPARKSNTPQLHTVSEKKEVKEISLGYSRDAHKKDIQSLIPSTNLERREIEDLGFNFANYPRTVFLKGVLVVAHPKKQHRFDARTKTQKNFYTTLFTLFSLNYSLPSILDLDCSSILDNFTVLKSVLSEEKIVDGIIKATGIQKIDFQLHDKEKKIKVLIVGNKIDLVGEEELKRMSAKAGLKAKYHDGIYVPSSAVTHEGIKLVISTITDLVRADIEKQTVEAENRGLVGNISKRGGCC